MFLWSDVWDTVIYETKYMGRKAVSQILRVLRDAHLSKIRCQTRKPWLSSKPFLNVPSAVSALQGEFREVWHKCSTCRFHSGRFKQCHSFQRPGRHSSTLDTLSINIQDFKDFKLCWNSCCSSSAHGCEFLQVNVNNISWSCSMEEDGDGQSWDITDATLDTFAILLGLALTARPFLVQKPREF